MGRGSSVGCDRGGLVHGGGERRSLSRLRTKGHFRHVHRPRRTALPLTSPYTHNIPRRPLMCSGTRYAQSRPIVYLTHVILIF